MQSINYQNIDNEVPLCLSFSNVDAYIIEENENENKNESENRYLIFPLTENNKKYKKTLELYQKLWREIKKQTKAINNNEPVKYKNDFMKIRLDS